MFRLLSVVGAVVFVAHVLAQQTPVWTPLSPPTRYLYGNKAELFNSTAAVRPHQMPVDVAGSCTVQRHSRVCRCSSAGFPFDATSPTFASSALRDALSAEAETLFYFRNLCLWDDETLAPSLSVMCALENRPCVDGEPAKVCRRECLQSIAAFESKRKALLALAQAYFGKLAAEANIPIDLFPNRCLSVWADFVGNCTSDVLFSDDEATCHRPLASTIAVGSDKFFMRSRVCSRLQSERTGFKCRPESKFAEGKCGTGQSAIMQTDNVIVSTSANTGSVQIKSKATGEAVAFSLLSVSELQETPTALGPRTDGAITLDVAQNFKPTLVCDHDAKSGQLRSVNITWRLLPTSTLVVNAELVRRDRIVSSHFTALKDTVKLTMSIDGHPFGKRDSRATRFAFIVAADFEPFAGPQPGLYASLLNTAVPCNVSEKINFENAVRSSFRFAMPRAATFDGRFMECSAFDVGVDRFVDTESLLANRRCGRVPLEIRLVDSFSHSFDLDPSLELVSEGGASDAETQQYRAELEALYAEGDAAEPEAAGIGGGAVAAIVIVVILLVVAAVVGVGCWLRRSGRLSAMQERGGAK
jgi:hypothetical protein